VDLARLPELLAEAVARTGAWAPALLFAASFAEYVVPPVPGDLLVLLGAWYAVHGELSWAATFAAVTLGALAGAALDWRIGRALAPRLASRAAARGPLTAERLDRFERAYRRWGPALLVANRFLPGIRAFLFVAAGASGIPLRAVVLWGGLSAALWNAALLAAGAFLATRVEDLVRLFRQYTGVVWALLGAVALIALLRLAWRRRPRRVAS
jgi:membrane-associated protein